MRSQIKFLGDMTGKHPVRLEVVPLAGKSTLVEETLEIDERTTIRPADLVEQKLAWILLQSSRIRRLSVTKF
jgi:hypothetical protein